MLQEQAVLKNDIITVIVPVYNVELYLDKCLNSIINQSYKNLEIILINDGSTDRSGEICEKYALLDNRIRVFHQQNMGISAARNKGLKNARGEIICFVDSDDFIHPQMYNMLKLIMDKTKAEIAVCRYRRIIENETITYKEYEGSNYNIYTNLEALELFFSQGHGQMVMAWNKLYKKTLFDGLRFPEGLIHEDTFTTYKAIYKANHIVCTDEVFYYYLRRNSSTTGQIFNNRRLDFFKACREIFYFLKDNNENDLFLKAIPWYLEQIVNYYKKLYNLRLYPKIRNELFINYRTIYHNYKPFRYHSIRKKMPYIVFFLSPFLFVKLLELKLRLRKMFNEYKK